MKGIKKMKGISEITERTGVYKKCPLCKKHYLDLRLHIWGTHLDAQEKKGVLHAGKNYSKIIRFIPIRKKKE